MTCLWCSGGGTVTGLGMLGFLLPFFGWLADHEGWLADYFAARAEVLVQGPCRGLEESIALTTKEASVFFEWLLEDVIAALLDRRGIVRIEPDQIRIERRPTIVLEYQRREGDWTRLVRPDGTVIALSPVAFGLLRERLLAWLNTHNVYRDKVVVT
jgi:hypothetical protein